MQVRPGRALLLAVLLSITTVASPLWAQETATLPDAPQNQQQPPASSPQSTSKPQAPSVSDLGFPAEATKPNPEEQARLDKRSHMLKIHQRLGLITLAPLVATVVTGGMAKEGERRFTGTTLTTGSTGGRNLHMALGTTTAAMYFTTASFAIFAPKIPNTPTRGPIRLHKALAWIHGPGMILTPILGAMAYQQRNAGERVHGIASAHAPVAYTTAIAYGAAMLAVSLKW